VRWTPEPDARVHARAAGRAVRLGGVRHCAAGSRRELGEPRRSSGVERWSTQALSPGTSPVQPARVRSRIMSTSEFAETPIIWNKGPCRQASRCRSPAYGIEVDPAPRICRGNRTRSAANGQAVDTDGRDQVELAADRVARR